MSDDRKIILQLEIDAKKGITDLLAVKDRIAQLKTEQKALNLETAEGQKTNEAYNAQIKALTKEQTSLSNALAQTAGTFEFEKGSIAANRAELSKLTAEYKNLAAPTKDQTAAIKALSDKLKEQEGAIGNTSRNVGNYGEALQGVTGVLGSFGPQISGIANGIKGLQGGLQTAVKGFGTLKGAIIGTGIGVLLLAFTELIQYFKQTDEGATALEGITGALGAVFKQVAGYVAQAGSALAGLADGSKSIEEIFTDLGDIIQENLTNRVKGFLVYGDALGKLFKGEFKEAAKLAVDGAVQIATGITGATDKMQAFALQAAVAAKQAYEFAVAQDALDDSQRALNITTAKNDQLVQKLIISAKNKTLSDQERIDLLKQANVIEEQSFISQQNIDKKRLELIKARNLTEQEAINYKLANDLKDAKSEADKIKIREKALQITDEQAQEQADLQKKVIDGETQYILLLEKNGNKIAVLDEKIIADREKAYQEYLAQLAAVNQAEITLENQRQTQVIKNIDYELSLKTNSDDRRIMLLKLRADEEIQLEKQLLDQKLSQLTTEGLKENANTEEIELQKTAILENSLANKLAIERSTSDQITQINADANAKRLKDDQDAAAKRQAANIKLFGQVVNGTNQILQAASQLNQDSLAADLKRNEDARAKELTAVGNNKAAQDKINAKYDKIESDQKKKSTKIDLDLKELQAIANVAVGVTQAIAEGGIAGLVTGALVAVAGAVQVASIESQKSQLKEGGLLNGPSHERGGISGTGRFGNIEVEGGEFVINKRATQNNLGLLHYINQVGEPPIFVNNNRSSVRRYAVGGILNDGGIAVSNISGRAESANQQISAMQHAISKLQVVVGVKDIVSGIDKKAQVIDRANVTK